MSRVMKRFGFIVTLLLSTLPAFSQTEVDKTPTRLRLTTRMIEQKYCDSDYLDMAMLRLSLRLMYTNVGEQPLILSKQSGLIHYLLVSRNEEEARDKHYEQNVHVGWV